MTDDAYWTKLRADRDQFLENAAALTRILVLYQKEEGAVNELRSGRAAMIELKSMKIKRMGSTPEKKHRHHNGAAPARRNEPGYLSPIYTPERDALIAEQLRLKKMSGKGISYNELFHKLQKLPGEPIASKAALYAHVRVNMSRLLSMENGVHAAE